jgi:GrpB-like predicted nucleotidyltransferase (UPF0157 family)
MRIEKYNIIWNTLFNAEKVKIGKILVNDVKVIEHIGSTAIPSQYSKPIIDLFVAVYELKPSSYYIEKLGAEYREIKIDMRNRYLIRKTWTKTYGGNQLDYGNSVQQTNDSGHIIAGIKVRFHDLRVTYASYFMMNGGDILAPKGYSRT